MHKVIYKYKLNKNNGSSKQLELPIGSEVLSVKIQNDEVVIWIVQPNGTNLLTEFRTFVGIFTGTVYEEPNLNDPLEYLKYIDTVIDDYGLVYHYFEIVKAVV